MKSSFKLKDPKGTKKSLIYFQSYFKDEGKSFIYSTGQHLSPSDWDLKAKKPANLNKRDSGSEIRNSINKELNTFKDFLDLLEARYNIIGEKLTIDLVRSKFDEQFERSDNDIENFFKVYDQFLEEKKNDSSDRANSVSTIKRYKCNKKLLQDFQKETGTQLRFSSIDRKFYNKFLKYCISVKKQSANTLSRNVGLFKTFMFWALKNKYTYNNDFQEFANIKRYATQEIALNKEQIKEIFKFDLSKNKKLDKVRDLFVLGCSTGFRYGNYSTINKSDVYNNCINVIDIKDSSKNLSVPLNNYSRAILEKYDYHLPHLSNQKFNKYLKELFQKLEYDEKIKKTMRYGKEIVQSEDFLYDRISSHTARRTFITVMKNEGVPDKVIMSYTGHRSIQNFNLYYKPSDMDKENYMSKVFG